VASLGRLHSGDWTPVEIEPIMPQGWDVVSHVPTLADAWGVNGPAIAQTMRDMMTAVPTTIEEARALLAEKPGYTSSGLLPVRVRNNTNGHADMSQGVEFDPVAPIRGPANALLDLFEGTKTGAVTPEASLLLGGMALSGGLMPSFRNSAPALRSGPIIPSDALVAGTGVEGGKYFHLESPATVAQKLKMSYKPPILEQRPIGADYPAGAPTDAAGNITHTIDGIPLGARYVAGRSGSGQVDAPIPSKEYDAISEGLLGATPTPATSRMLRGDGGRLTRGFDPNTGDPAFQLQFNKSLPPGAAADTIAHEIGHGIDYLARTIPQDGIKRELGAIYHTLNSPQSIKNGISTPQNLYGYSDAEAPMELMAEAIRAYMQNPNYIKTVAPNVAARIRNAVNDNPMIKNTIQFNGVAGLAVAGGAAAMAQPAEAAPTPEQATPAPVDEWQPVSREPIAVEPVSATVH